MWMNSQKLKSQMLPLYQNKSLLKDNHIFQFISYLIFVPVRNIPIWCPSGAVIKYLVWSEADQN